LRKFVEVRFTGVHQLKVNCFRYWEENEEAVMFKKIIFLLFGVLDWRMSRLLRAGMLSPFDNSVTLSDCVESGGFALVEGVLRGVDFFMLVRPFAKKNGRRSL